MTRENNAESRRAKAQLTALRVLVYIILILSLIHI